MATPKQHMKQAKRNKDFLNCILETDFSEWKITAMFYCALHYMNWYMHIRYEKDDAEIKSHNLLNTEISQNCDRDMVINYMSLYNNSRKSRYDCINVSKDVKSSNDMLSKIEKQIERFAIERSS